MKIILENIALITSLLGGGGLWIKHNDKGIIHELTNSLIENLAIITELLIGGVGWFFGGMNKLF